MVSICLQSLSTQLGERTLLTWRLLHNVGRRDRERLAMQLRQHASDLFDTGEPAKHSVASPLCTIAEDLRNGAVHGYRLLRNEAASAFITWAMDSYGVSQHEHGTSVTIGLSQ